MVLHCVHFDLINEIYLNKNSSNIELQKEIYKATKIKSLLLTFWSIERELIILEKSKYLFNITYVTIINA